SESACAFVPRKWIGRTMQPGRETAFPTLRIGPEMPRGATSGDTPPRRRLPYAIWTRGTHSSTRSRRKEQMKQMVFKYQRGSSLLLAIIIIAVLSIVALGIVKMGSTEADAVGAKRRYDHAVTCSDAARDLLLSQFKTYSVTPTSLTLNQVIDDQVM